MRWVLPGGRCAARWYALPCVWRFGSSVVQALVSGQARERALQIVGASSFGG